MLRPFDYRGAGRISVHKLDANDPKSLASRATRCGVKTLTPISAAVAADRSTAPAAASFATLIAA